MQRLVVVLFCLSAASAHGFIKEDGDVVTVPHLNEVKPAKPEYEENAKQQFSDECVQPDLLNYVVFCHKSPLHGESKLAEERQDHPHEIDCNKAPEVWQSKCLAEFNAAFNLSRPNTEETEAAFAQGGEGHSFLKIHHSKAKDLDEQQSLGPAQSFLDLGMLAKTSLPFTGARWGQTSISYCYTPKAPGKALTTTFTTAFQHIAAHTPLRFYAVKCTASGHKIDIVQVKGFADSMVGLRELGAPSSTAWSKRAGAYGTAVAKAKAAGKPPPPPLPAAPKPTSQPLHFDPAGWGVEGAIHELVHSIGFHHAHQSNDRNTFVHLVKPKPKPKPVTNQWTWCNNNVYQIQAGPLHGRYDYNSIMHYPQHVSVGNGCGNGPKMFAQRKPHPKPALYAGNPAAIGPSPLLTAEDRVAINHVYNGVPAV